MVAELVDLSDAKCRPWQRLAVNALSTNVLKLMNYELLESSVISF